MVAVQETYRFTVEEYYRMGEVGILSPDIRVELVDGEIRRMAPVHPPHASMVKRLTVALVARLQDTAVVGVQDPIHLDEFNEPQPDLTVMRSRDDYYGSRHPTPADVLLAIEVADTSLRYDRDEKIPRYGRYGIPEAWLVMCKLGRSRSSRSLTPGGTGDSACLSRGEEIVSVSVEGLRVRVDEALG